MVADLAGRNVKLSIGGSGTHPTDPMGMKTISSNYTPPRNTAKLSCITSHALPTTEPLNEGSCGT